MKPLSPIPDRGIDGILSRDPLSIIFRHLLFGKPKRWSRREWVEEQASVLKLVSTSCFAIVWSLHPTVFEARAASNRVSLVQRLPQLRKLVLKFRFTSVTEDSVVFGSSVSANLAKFCPRLRVLKCTLTIGGTDPAAMRAATSQNNFTMLHMDFTDDYSLGYAGTPYSPMQLKQIEVPDEVCVEITQMKCSNLPKNTHSVLIDGTGRELGAITFFAFVKSSSIQSLTIGPTGLECIIGSCATSACLHSNLPKSLRSLTLEHASQYWPGSAFPAQLEKLELIDVCWRANSIPHLKSLQKFKHLILNFSSSSEDGKGYNFDTFDVSSLPDSLETLKIEGEYPFRDKASMTIVGKAPASLKTAYLKNIEWPNAPDHVSVLEHLPEKRRRMDDE